MASHNQYCQFCQILQKKSTNHLIIAQNEQCFAFHDLNIATSRAHVLACPKEHIETALDVTNTAILERLMAFGEQTMRALYLERYKVQPDKHAFRFGFHLPPHVSIFHIHLHCFILPIQNVMYDKYLYGFGLKSIETIQQRIHEMKNAKL